MTELYDSSSNENIAQLSCQLRDEDISVRKNTVEAIGRICNPEAVPLLISALADKEIEVIDAAVHSLAKFADSRIVSALVDQLENKALHLPGLMAEMGLDTRDPLCRLVVALSEAFRELRDSRALIPLLEALDVWGMTEAFCSIFDALKAIIIAEPHALLPALQHHDAGIRYNATRFLDVLSLPTLKEASGLALQDKDAGIRRHAIATLEKQHDQWATDLLHHALSDSDLTVCVSAASALYTQGDNRGKAILLAYATHKSARIRAEAIELIASAYKPGNDLSPILSALEDKSKRVRECAANSLMNIDNQAAFACALNALTSSRFPEVRKSSLSN